MDNAVAYANMDAVKAVCAKLKAEGVEPENIRALLERTIRFHAITRMGYAPSSPTRTELKGDERRSVEAVERFLLFVIALAKEELCGKALTVLVMQDVFDVSVVKRCESLFAIVENHIGVWKEAFFFDACKNLILRMSNDLLKRLSRTVDTNFCGRILILLAKSLPLNEKSGLNLPGHFNTANVTTFDREATTKGQGEEEATKGMEDGHAHGPLSNNSSISVQQKVEVEAAAEEDGRAVEKVEDVDMEVGEIREEHSVEPTTSADSAANPPLDSQLYSQFWEIQTHLSNPPFLLQDPATLKRFESNLTEVLRVFTSYKLEQSKADSESGGGGLGRDRRRETANLALPHPGHKSANHHPVQQNGTAHSTEEATDRSANEVEMKVAVLASAEAETEDTFFAKYLTNHKLFNLQLADSQFRRYFLLQCLIVTNHLLHCKSQPQATTTTTTVKLKETSATPATSDSSLKEIADKCAALLKDTHPRGGHFSDCVKKILNREKMWVSWKGEGCPDLPATAAQLEVLMFKKKPQLRHDPRIINLGNKELSRLWNINPDNLDACRDKKRDSAPDLIKFLEDGLDQQDPEQQVEEQYKLVNDERYQWMASRFLLHSSEHYMSSVVSDPKAARPSGAKHLERAILNTALAIPELKERALKIQSAQKRLDEEKAARAAKEKALQEEEQRAKAELDEKMRVRESSVKEEIQASATADNHDSNKERTKNKALKASSSSGLSADTTSSEEKSVRGNKEPSGNSKDSKERPKSEVGDASPSEKKRAGKDADSPRQSKEQRLRAELEEKRRSKDAGREADSQMETKEHRSRAEPADEKRRAREDNHERSRSKDPGSKERLKRKANSDHRDEKDSTDRGSRDPKESASRERPKRTRHQ